MAPANLVLLLAFWPLIFVHHFHFACSSSRQVVSKNDVLPSQSSSSSTTTACVNCTICPYPCHNLSPPPPPPFSGYPLYGAPPPPPPSSSSGFPSYGAPLPPQAEGNCPPGQVQCCHYPPPNPYTYLPSDAHSLCPNFPTMITFISIIMLLASFAALF